MIADKRDFRLAKDLRPSRYALRFDLDLDNWISRGRAQIDLHLAAPQREITLHAVELDIREVKLAEGPAPEEISYEEQSQTATLRFAGEIPAGQHTLEIEW